MKTPNDYSADNSRVSYQQEMTNTLYGVNMFLMFVYYILLILLIFMGYKYYLVRNQERVIMIFVAFLIAYPFIIYPIQYYVFRAITGIRNTIYNNVYLSSNW